MTNNILTVAELEARMRPGALSKKGFLGPAESLEAVIDQDARTLASQGIWYDQIAEALERILMSAFEQARDAQPRKYGRGRFPNLYHPETLPDFALDNLPPPETGILVDDLQVFTCKYRGFQTCPWECAVTPNWGSFDFLILNRKTAEYVTGPGLIVHLIRNHRFFEGIESPFRTDPTKAIRVLEISPEPVA
jgi:hypothetical protein